MNYRPLVVYWNNIPTPYMIERFNALSDRNNFEFEAWFNDKIEKDRSWNIDESTWRFKYRYMPTTSLFGRRLRWASPVFMTRPDVMVSLYAEPVFVFGWILAKLLGVRTAFWCQVTMDRWVKRKSWKNILKRWMFPRVDVTLGSGQDSRKFSMQYGTASDKAMCLQHSIDVKHYAAGAAIHRLKKVEIAKELGLHGVVFVYVGRLWWGKGLSYLLDAFALAQKAFDGEMSLLIVGDGEEETKLRDWVNESHVPNVVFAGFQQKSELPRFYAASDVFVFPTLGDPYGLVVDEAMASSLAVISTSSAGEIRERIDDGVNGYIVPPDNSEALAEKMLVLAQDKEFREKMGACSYEKIKNNTPEKWAEDFERIVYGLVGHDSSCGTAS